MRYIWFIVVLTILPSIYLTLRIVQRTIFEENAKRFVQREFKFVQTQVVNSHFKFDQKQPVIELLLIGEELSKDLIDSLSKRLPLYKLKGTSLHLRQGLDAKEGIDLAQIKASILEDVFSERESTDSLLHSSTKFDRSFSDLQGELKSLYPNMRSFALTTAVATRLDSARIDSVTLFVASFKNRIQRAERVRLFSWLKARLKADSLKLVIE